MPVSMEFCHKEETNELLYDNAENPLLPKCKEETHLLCQDDDYPSSNGRDVLANKESSVWEKNKIVLWNIVYDHIYRRRFISTIMVYFAIFAQEWLFAMIGPILPALQVLLEMDLPTLSWMITVYSVGYLTGCGLHGPLRVRNCNLCLLVCYAFLHGVCSIITPRCPSFCLILVVRFFAGVAHGGTDTAIHEQLFVIWGREGGPFNQLLNASLAFGGAMSSLTIKELLQDIYVESKFTGNANSTNNVYQYEYTSTPSITYNTTVGPLLPRLETRVYFAFTLAGVMSFLSVFPFIAEYTASYTGLWVYSYETPRQQTYSTDKGNSIFKSGVVVVILLLLANLFLNGLLDSVQTYLASFVNSVFLQDMDIGASLTSAYYWTQTMGNFLFMFVSLVISTRGVLIISSVGSCAALTMLLVSAILRFLAGIWMAVISLGLFLPPALPAMYVFVDENISPFIGVLASMFLISGALGMIVFEYAMGHIPLSIFPHSLLAEYSVMLTSLLIVFLILHTRYKCELLS